MTDEHRTTFEAAVCSQALCWDAAKGEYVNPGVQRLYAAWSAQSSRIAELEPYRDELLKIAEDVGEASDPFSAWEAIHALQSQLEQNRKLLGEALKVIEEETKTEWPPGKSVCGLCLCGIEPGADHLSGCLVSRLRAASTEPVKESKDG